MFATYMYFVANFTLFLNLFKIKHKNQNFFKKSSQNKKSPKKEFTSLILTIENQANYSRLNPLHQRIFLIEPCTM